MPTASEVADQQKQQLLEQLQDPNFALQLAKAMASTEAGRKQLSDAVARYSQEASKHEVIASASKLDAFWLYECFSRGTRKTLEEVFDGAELPFPLDLVAGITEKQINSLQTVFDIPDADRHAHWAYVYTRVNRRAHENRLASDKLSDKLRQTIRATNLPEAFFLLAFSYLLENRREPARKEQKDGLWAKENERTQKNAATLQAAVEEVRNFMQLANEGDAKGRSKLRLPVAASWYREHRLDALLSGLMKAAEEDKTGSSRDFDGIYARDRKYNSAKKLKDHTDWTYRAADRVAEILAEGKGRKNRDLQGAVILFSQWGFKLSPRSQKTARERRKVTS